MILLVVATSVVVLLCSLALCRYVLWMRRMKKERYHKDHIKLELEPFDEEELKFLEEQVQFDDEKQLIDVNNI
jgi:hypothetical protein